MLKNTGAYHDYARVVQWQPCGRDWIQENLTGIEIDDDLVALGIPKLDIVPGVLPPEYREGSEFAAG